MFRPWLALCLLPLLWASCSESPRQEAAPSAETPSPDGQSQESRPIDPPAAEWVRVYAPERAWNGYTLTLHHGRIPVLLDMNGLQVHDWPEARVKSRIRLLPDGSILAIGLGRRIVEYDWEGRESWRFETPGAIPHHDVVRLANGNTLVLLQVEGEPADTLLEVDRAGHVVWSWKALEHLRDRFPDPPQHPGDITHVNSVQELPENPWYTGGDVRFRPGNLLLSARNLNAALIIDRQTGAVLWWHSQGFDLQHEVVMNGPGMAEPGLIQVFNNRRGSFYGDRQSEILELDPRTAPGNNAISWRYKAPGFFSPTAGLQQALPNGNVLITSTRGRRIFEVTREGETVWQWAPPYEPSRGSRVAPDACPQLPSLRSRRTHPVRPPPGYRHVDPEAYRFARRGSRTKVQAAGETRTVLKLERDCRRLLLPADATLELGYGVDPERLRAAPGGREGTFPVFVARLLPEGGGEELELLRDWVEPEGRPWRSASVFLGEHGLETVQLCLSIEGGSGPDVPPKARFAYWQQPQARVPEEGAPRVDTSSLGDLTPEELAVRRQHLKALGYVD